MAGYRLTGDGTAVRVSAASNYTRNFPASIPIGSHSEFVAINETEHAVTLQIDLSTDQAVIETRNHRTNRRPYTNSGQVVEEIKLDSKSFERFVVRRVDDGNAVAALDITFSGVTTTHGTAINADSHEYVAVIHDVTLVGQL